MAEEEAQGTQEKSEKEAQQETPLLDEIVDATKLKPTDDGYTVTRQGVQAFIDELIKPECEIEQVNSAAVDSMIAEIDRKISRQLDAILHDKSFQGLESAWRSLKYLIDKTDFRENTRIKILNVTKDELLDDFEDSPEVFKSGLYSTVYTAEYGQFGGKPYGLMIGNYELKPNAPDVKLLQYMASVAATAHAPFVAAGSPSFFGLDDFSELPGLKDLESIFYGPQYIKWRSFRETDDSRWTALTVPRFMLRLPYDLENNPVKEFDYDEDYSAGNDAYLWGNAAFALASRITNSFAQHRWYANIIGPMAGGAVEDLPLHQYQALEGIQTKTPTDILISERREYELAEQGFIPLTMRKGSDNAAFFSANSAQKAKKFPDTKEGKEAQVNYALGTQMPYLLIISRLAHYLKVIQRENIGTWKEKNDLERELNLWISQYVANQENPLPSVRSRKPLRSVQIDVNDVEGEPGWYRVSMKVRPHLKYMGAYFTLSLVGKLDKE
ncbi:type VI secretion system contractile sheath large subunit [Desulfococcaceae bacterium HSG7]|nr:type VI secretion system contractile sheath large subunit [Desulfococcaceae bacterium HSG7]